MTKKVTKKRRGPAPSTADVLAQMKDPASVVPNKQEEQRHLRLLAMWHYVIDLGQCSVDDLLKHPLFAHIPRTTLEHWSRTDNWKAMRHETVQKWSNHVINAVGSELVQQRLAEIKNLQTVKVKVLERLNITHVFEPHITKDVEQEMFNEQEAHDVALSKGDDPPKRKARTFMCKECGRAEIGHNDAFWGVRGDALVNAYAKLVELEFEIAERVKDVLGLATTVQTPGTGNTDAAETLTTQTLTKEEARVAAHAVLQQRRLALTGPSSDVSGDG